jgi:hypothetical protein
MNDGTAYFVKAISYASKFNSENQVLLSIILISSSWTCSIKTLWIRNVQTP